MEHGQRPQIHRMAWHAPFQDVTNRVQIRAAMVVNHTFRVAGGARGVVQGNRFPLVGWHTPSKIGIACGNEGFVFDFT